MFPIVLTTRAIRQITTPIGLIHAMTDNFVWVRVYEARRKLNAHSIGNPPLPHGVVLKTTSSSVAAMVESLQKKEESVTVYYQPSSNTCIYWYFLVVALSSDAGLLMYTIILSE